MEQQGGVNNNPLGFLLLLVGIIICSFIWIFTQQKPEGLHYHSFRTDHEYGDKIQVGYKTGVIVGFTVTDTGQVYYEYQSYINDDMDTVIFTCPMEDAKSVE